jgi:LCP family protein required for cell wall assembly
MSQRREPAPRPRDLDAVRVRHGTRQVEHPVTRYAGIVVAAVLGFTLVYYLTFSGQLAGAIDAPDNRGLINDLPDDGADDASAGRSLNILLMGTDERNGANAKLAGDVEGMRSDTALLMHISEDRTRVDVVSIPRDAIVDIPDCTLYDGTVVPGGTGKKFNAAFSLGGRAKDRSEAAACAINTVQKMSGIRIDHYVVVDMTGFINMIDSLGGVPMCVPERIVGVDVDLELEVGLQNFDGRTALEYARLRKASEGGVSGSDLQRITRQQELLRQTARTALSKNMLTNAGELTQFIRAGAESLTMDPQLAKTEYMVGLAYSLRNLNDGGLTFTTVPWEYTEDFLSVNILPEAEEMWDDVRNDRPISISVEGDGSSQWNTGREDSNSGDGADATSENPTDNGDTPSDRTGDDNLLAACAA